MGTQNDSPNEHPVGQDQAVIYKIMRAIVKRAAELPIKVQDIVDGANELVPSDVSTPPFMPEVPEKHR